MVKEFIEGWDLLQILGEGTFAEVKLLVNRDTGEACAMKEINIKDNPRADKTAKKEICVHKLLKHPNIVQCYGSRIELERQFIFLEYCSGGELFDRIGTNIAMICPLLSNVVRFFNYITVLNI
jgi:serine/threonine-protein kinase Chk1